MSSLNSSQFTSQSQLNKLEYRKALEQLPALDNDTIDNMERVERAQQALEKAINLTTATTPNASERHMDSLLLQKVGELALCCAESLEVNTNAYDWHELANHVRSNPEHWSFQLPLQIPSFGFVHGTFEPTPPSQRPRAPRRRAERQRPAATARPELVDKLEKVDEDSKMVSMVHSYIREACRSGPVSYFHVVLDPHSFSRTVQNIYYVSFLVNDGKVSVYIPEEYGIPMVRTISKSAARDHDAERKQFVVSLDMDYWEKLIQAFNIKEAKMNLYKK